MDRITTALLQDFVLEQSLQAKAIAAFQEAAKAALAASSDGAPGRDDFKTQTSTAETLFALGVSPVSVGEVDKAR